MRRHVLHRRLSPGLLVPPVVVKHHVPAQQARDQAARGAEAGRGDERRLVLGLLVLAEDVARHEAHDVGEGYTNRGQNDTATLVRDVIVVPGRKQDRRSRGTPDHHEGGIVRELDLAVDVVDGSIDDEADERERETQHDEGKTDPQQIRAEGQDKQHDGTADVRRNGVQIRLDDLVAQPLDDLRHEQRHGLDGHAEADLDEQEAVRRRMAEDAERVAQVELLGDDGRRVDLHAVEGEGLLVLGQEAGLGRAEREVPVGEDGEEDREGALDDEEVTPLVEAGLDVEDAVGEEAALGGVRPEH